MKEVTYQYERKEEFTWGSKWTTKIKITIGLAADHKKRTRAGKR